MRPLLLAALILAASAPPAWACDNGVAIEIDPRVSRLMLAERALRDGDAARGVREALAIFPRAAEEMEPKDLLLARASRIAAVAAVRLDGRIAGATTPAEREARRTWAVSYLRRLSLKRLQDATVLTDLAEALCRRPETRAEALRMLEHLASKDLVASPEGWAALAELRRAAGNTVGGDLARERCEKAAKVKAVCGQKNS
jgi:hypothetical protein